MEKTGIVILVLLVLLIISPLLINLFMSNDLLVDEKKTEGFTDASAGGSGDNDNTKITVHASIPLTKDMIKNTSDSIVNRFDVIGRELITKQQNTK